MAKFVPASRQNHYVPEWYQTGFSTPGCQNWLLEISPPRLRQDGIPIHFVPRPRSPKSSFWEKDLYVTALGDVINDEIETILFQGIDAFGAKAVRAFVDGDPVRMHHNYQALFDYLGAQKLRTPKGLDWIRSRYPALNQVELMTELQYLRQMFGTVWVEAVPEIVSAQDSDVKFLISDHPVTTFNAALAQASPALAYPNDANILLNGTQTLFALDGNHCLILTHLPYAKTPADVALLRKRINARHFGATLGRTDRVIRERILGADEVIAINHVLKQRARRYIAAGEREWLFPERQAPFDLHRTAEILRPPPDELAFFGGEIYIGYRDGTSGYCDEHGRTSKEHEFVSKPLPTQPPTPRAPCPCGSGEAYRDCCAAIAPSERPPWDVLSLRERNLALIRAVVGILELDQGKDWTQVRRELSDEQVVRLHRFAQALWPEDTDLVELLPKPGDGVSRAIFMGLSDPRTVGMSVISMMPLFDQVLVLNPFLNPRNIAPDCNPLKMPSAYKQQLLKNVMFLLTLEPLIRASKVLLFPDPGDISPAFGQAMRTMAKERSKGWKLTDKHLEQFRWLGEDDIGRALAQGSPEAQAAAIRKYSPGLTDEEVARTVAYMQRKAELDPFAVLQSPPSGASSNFLILRGVNLELGLFIAQITGAALITDSDALWEHLHLHTRAMSDFESQEDLTRFALLPYQGYLHPEDALGAADLPSAVHLRNVLVALQQPGDPQVGHRARLEAACSVFATSPLDLGANATHPDFVATMHLTVSMPSRGFDSSTAQRLSVAFGRDDAPRALPIAILRRTMEPDDQPSL